MSQAAPKHPWIIEPTEQTFERDVLERSRSVPVVVDFWADWCQPCRLLGPMLEKLAAEYGGRFILAKVDSERSPGIAAAFRVQSIPAVFALRDGNVVDGFVGLTSEEDLRRWIEGIMPSPAEQLLAEAAGLEASDPHGAEARYRQALELLSADDARASIGLARLLVKQKRIAEGRKLLAALEERGFLEPEAEQIKAELEIHEQAQEAGDVAACRAALAASPNELNLQFQLAEALAARGTYEEALDLCLKIVQADKEGLGQQARKTMVNVFQLIPHSELTSTYRRRLATALY